MEQDIVKSFPLATGVFAFILRCILREHAFHIRLESVSTADENFLTICFHQGFIIDNGKGFHLIVIGQYSEYKAPDLEPCAERKETGTRLLFRLLPRRVLHEKGSRMTITWTVSVVFIFSRNKTSSVGVF